jgi:hypothetical protein
MAGRDEGGYESLDVVFVVVEVDRQPGLARCPAVPVVPRGLYRAAVAAGTGPGWASYDVDAATMHLERHERGIHAV